MIFIVYKTTCLVNQKFYFGVHKQRDQIFDGYLGSGRLIRRSIQKHGSVNFIREILFVFEDSQLAYLKERELIKPFLKDAQCYNIHPGGLGATSLPPNTHTPEWRAKVSAARKGVRVQSDAALRRQSERMLLDNPNYRPGVREKISAAKKGKSSPNKGKKLSIEVRQKMSDSRRGVAKPNQCKRVCIDGINYDSIKLAAHTLNVSTACIIRWCQSGIRGIYVSTLTVSS